MENITDFSESKERDPETKQKDLSEALESVLQHVGNMGTYQRLLFIGMLPFGFVWAFGYFGQMFITATPQNHWCYVPELAELSMELRRNLSIPGAATGGGDWDRCSVFQADWATVLETLTPPPEGTPAEPCRHGWEYHLEDIPYHTVVSERDWVCDRAHLVPWSQTISFIGSMTGGLLFGRVADKFGRIVALVGANLVGCIGGVGTIFTQGFWDFSACRFLVGMSVDSCFMMFYILAMEYVGPNHRTWVANMSIALYFGGGCLMLPWLALLVADWRRLALYTALPMAVALLTPFTVPESARWLASQGKIDKAVKMFRRFEKINRTKIPKDVMDEFITVARSSPDPRGDLRALFRSRPLRHMLLTLILSFMSVAVVFDILIRLSETLGGDFFITFTLSSATEVPSIVILVLLLDRFGRRMLAFGPLILVAVLVIIIIFVPPGVPSVSAAVAARFFNNMSYNVMLQWSPELVPTPQRASACALVAVSAFAAVVLTPFIVYSGRAWSPLPLICAGALAAAGGALMLRLPETARRPLPQTLDDGERLADTATDGGLCCFNRRNKINEDIEDMKRKSADDQVS